MLSDSITHLRFLHDFFRSPLGHSCFTASGPCFNWSFDCHGIIGSYVVVKRIVSISGSIAHSVLSGLGCALWLQRTYGIEWLQPIYGAVVASLISALIIGWVHLRYREREDAIIAMIWSVGWPSGSSLSLKSGFNVELMNFLLGMSFG